MRNGGTGPPRGAVSARGRWALAAAALLTAMALPGIPPATAEPSFTFEGGGYGHSVGMSQYGAYGMALEGYTWQEILQHYFTGASPAAADPALLARLIWVGLAQEQTRLALKVVPTGADSAIPATFTLGNAALSVAGGETMTIEVLGGGSCRMSAPAGTLEGPCSIDATWDGDQEQPTTAVQLVGCVLPDWNAPGGTVWKPCRYARGELHVRPDNDSATVHLSLEIDIEDYILGISESPYAWGTTGGQAALEAQAVAARSYALYRAVMRGDPSSRPWCWCQLYDTTVDQFFVGWGHGTQPWIDAVAATAGQVMVHPSETRDGVLIPIQTFYSSSTFGWTEDSENGFTAYVPYLRAVDDHWSTLPAVGNPKARWSRSFTAGRLASLLPGLSTVTGAEVTRCSATGAALEITFTGDGGRRAFSTRDLRSRLNLPSMQVIDVGAPPDGSPACQGFALAPADPGGPPILAGVAVNDDDVEDSAGNGDGSAQCGEAIEVITTLVNQGGDLTGITAALSEDDPYVRILWNTTSAFPDLPAGGAAANLSDWDLAVAAGAPNGHTAHLTLRVTAANGGPWNLDVPLPIACGASPAGLVAGPGDVDGDRVPDVAVAYARPGEPARLQVRSGAAGSILGTYTLARAGFLPIAAVTLPSFAGSSAAEVAVLLTRPGTTARVVVLDSGTGRRIRAIGLPATAAYVDLAALPPAGDASAPRLAVLAKKAGGQTRVLLRDAATGAALSTIGLGAGLTPVAVAATADTSGEPLLAVLADGPGGRLQVSIRRAADGVPVRTILLAGDLAAGGLAVIPGPGWGQVLVVVGGAPDGTVRLIAADPTSGEVLADNPVAGLTSATDLEPLSNLGRGPSADVAILGRAPSGAAATVVMDPLRGLVVTVTSSPASHPAQDLSPLSGSRLADLGSSASGELLVTVRLAATGAEICSFTIS